MVTYGLQAAKGRRFAKRSYPLEFWLTRKAGENWWLVNRVDFEEL
jgi:hypothetical protein